MSALDNPILNSPYSAPARHWALDERGMPTGETVEGRRRSEFIIPIAQSRRTGQQGELRYTDVEGPAATRANDLVNEIRTQVDTWRKATSTPAGVTYETARLIYHWREQSRERPLFFCQVEAAETIIWLTEVARREPRFKRYWDLVEERSSEANPAFSPLQQRLCTGTVLTQDSHFDWMEVRAQVKTSR